jgi:hypothetical protein
MTLAVTPNISHSFLKISFSRKAAPLLIVSRVSSNSSGLFGICRLGKRKVFSKCKYRALRHDSPREEKAKSTASSKASLNSWQIIPDESPGGRALLTRSIRQRISFVKGRFELSALSIQIWTLNFGARLSKLPSFFLVLARAVGIPNPNLC